MIKIDTKKDIFLIKEEYKSDVFSCRFDGGLALIKYSSSGTEYSYRKTDVIIEESIGERILLSNKSLQYNGAVLPFASSADLYKSGLKVFFENGTNRFLPKGMYQILNEDIGDVQGGFLEYLLEVSQHTVIEGDGELNDFLFNQFDKLLTDTVNPDSALVSYISGTHRSRLGRFVKKPVFPFSFNPSQKEAVENVWKSNISVIEGPPGTGKTQTILNLIANLAIFGGNSVAVVSGNNSATANVAEKLDEFGYGFFVAQLGSTANKSVFFANQPQVPLFKPKASGARSEIHSDMERISALMEISNNIAKLDLMRDAYLLERNHFENYLGKLDYEGLKKLSFYKLSADDVMAFLAEINVAKRRGIQDGILHKAKLLFKHGFTGFGKLKASEAEVLLSFQKRYYELKIESIDREIKAFEAQLDGNSFDLLLKSYQIRSKDLFEYELNDKFRTLKSPEDFSLSDYYRRFGEFLQRYPVILSTTHSLRSCVPRDFLFDYVIIDEASQVDLVSGALALSCARNVIIVGDDKQLPHVVDLSIKEKLRASDFDSRYDYFGHSILTSVNAIYGNSIPRSMLREHYRCDPRIIGFCNQKYYGGCLIPHRKTSETDALRIFRTSEGNHMREVTTGPSQGRHNRREIDVTIEEVLSDVVEMKDIGFVTPFRKQVEKAKEYLPGGIEVNTVHKFQGREKQVMVMSTVLSGTRSGGKAFKFVDDPRLMNVAVSRARDVFMLVTDGSLFGSKGKEVRDLLKYIDYSTFGEGVIDSEIVSIFDLLYADFSNKLKSLEARLLNISRFKSENILATVIGDILSEPEYDSLDFKTQVSLKNIFASTEKLSESETRYVKNNASVDFVIYFKLDKKPLIAVEVDGFGYHENSPEQLKKDGIKNEIFGKYGLPILRLPTNGSGEDLKLRKSLSKLLSLDEVGDSSQEA